MSRRIVIASWGSLGDVFPYVGLGKALQARGHRVRIAMPGFYRELVEGEGLDFHPMPPDVDPDDRERIARVMHPTRGPERIIRDWVAPAVRDQYAALEEAVADADAVVSHPVTFAAPLVAEKRRLPWAATVLAPMSLMSVTDWPVTRGAPLLAPLARWRWGARLMRRVVDRVTRAWLEPVVRFRRELGLRTTGNPLLDAQFTPALNLGLFSRVLAAPQPDWPPNLHVTGFVFYNGPGALDPQLESFLAAGPPPVVFTLGSSAVGAAGAFYEESAAAVARLGARAVLLRGPFPANEPVRTKSPDILVVERASHQLLFPRAAAIVHHGGVGTTGQGLRSGRPMLVVPHSHDQPDNAARVARLGVSRTLYPSGYRSTRVARELDLLLRDSRYRENAERIGETVRAEQGAAAAAALIERL
jgi:UDP:flavonoid glycosyltransferase YjiC (YdhE family)